MVAGSTKGSIISISYSSIILIRCAKIESSFHLYPLITFPIKEIGQSSFNSYEKIETLNPNVFPARINSSAIETLFAPPRKRIFIFYM